MNFGSLMTDIRLVFSLSHTQHRILGDKRSKVCEKAFLTHSTHSCRAAHTLSTAHTNCLVFVLSMANSQIQVLHIRTQLEFRSGHSFEVCRLNLDTVLRSGFRDMDFKVSQVEFGFLCTSTPSSKCGKFQRSSRHCWALLGGNCISKCQCGTSKFSLQCLSGSCCLNLSY